jgi:hypothetical protein
VSINVIQRAISIVERQRSLSIQSSCTALLDDADIAVEHGVDDET